MISNSLDIVFIHSDIHNRLCNDFSHAILCLCNLVVTVSADDYFNNMDLFLIRVWISNYIHQNMWDEITHSFPNFKGAAFKVWEWISNSSHTLVGMWILIHNLIHVSKRGP